MKLSKMITLLVLPLTFTASLGYANSIRDVMMEPIGISAFESADEVPNYSFGCYLAYRTNQTERDDMQQTIVRLRAVRN